MRSFPVIPTVHPYTRAMVTAWHTVILLPRTSEGRRVFSGNSESSLQNLTATGKVLSRRSSLRYAAASLQSTPVILSLLQVVGFVKIVQNVENVRILWLVGLVENASVFRYPLCAPCSVLCAPSGTVGG
jgi:hypothetical protein